MAIGSREAPGARRFNEPAFRHIQGRVFSNLVKWLALPGYEDTQCGFKCFRDQAARDLFQAQTFDGMSFDVEVPIDWYYQSESRVRLLRDPIRMLADLLTIRRNWRRGLYERRSEK